MQSMNSMTKQEENVERLKQRLSQKNLSIRSRENRNKGSHRQINTNVDSLLETEPMTQIDSGLVSLKRKLNGDSDTH